MKKIMVLFYFHFLLTLTCLGQTGAGNLLLGGSLNFKDQDYQTAPDYYSKTGNYNIHLQGGRFVRDNLVVGLGLLYDTGTGTTDYPNQSMPYYNHYKANVFSAGPFIRKYAPLTERFFFFGQASTSLTYRKLIQETATNQVSQSTQSKSYGIQAGLSPGLTYFVTNKTGLDLSLTGLSYSFAKDQDTQNKMHTFNLGLDLTSLNYGIRFYFAR